MSFFVSYFKSRKSVFIMLLLFSVIFGVTFFLYKLPIKAVLYPAALCCAAGAVFLVWDIKKVYSLHRQLNRSRELSDETADYVPQPHDIISADYSAIIKHLCENERKEKERAAEKYADTVSYYTAWAHQIKTPIASMYLQLQNEDTALSRRLSAELQRIEQYVEMVMMYYKLDNHSADFIFKEYDLDEIIKAVLKRFSCEFIDRKLSLSYVPVCKKVVTDRKRLEFVIGQVFSNSLKYTPHGTVSVTLEDGETLCIADTGIGIAPEDLPLIFERGYTGLNGRLDVKASGIGLYLCKKICTELGHGICAVSQPGKGTEIRINFNENRFAGE